MATDVRRDGVRPGTVEKTDSGNFYRGAVEVEWEQGRAALKRNAAPLIRLIREMKSPSAKPPRLEWTSGDVAMHLVQTFRDDLANLEGRGEPYAVGDRGVLASGAQESARKLAAEQERDPKKLADMLETEVNRFLENTADRDPMQPVPLAQGHTMTLANLVGTLLGEVLVHGYDIAKAEGKQWRMEPEAARLAVYATTATLPLGVNPETTKELDVRINMRIRGGQCFQIHLHNGTGKTEPCGKADATVSADAEALLLVGFGRVGPIGTALRGKMFAWGKRPDIPVRIGKYLLPI